MKISELKAELEKGDKEYKGFCHDCRKQVEIKARMSEGEAIQIEGGAIYKVKQGLKHEYFFKCDECFNSDPILHDFRKCEVYSRAIGYLRPVNQWNKGKKEEFGMRKVFVNTKDK